MDEKKLREKLKLIISETLGVDEGEITDNADFVDDLGADSLDVVEITIGIEEAFDVNLDGDEESLEKLKTFGRAVEYLAKKLK